MRTRSIVSSLVMATLVALSTFAFGCAQTPAEPTGIRSVASAAGASSRPTVAETPTPSASPSPSPTPTAKCECTSVSYQFDPGGDTPAWNTYLVHGRSQWRVGFRIDVKCNGTGESNKCTVFQIEKGKLTWTVGGRPGEIVGKEKKVTNFHKGKFGDPWEKEYSDALGADYPPNETGKMSLALDMEFEIKCVSSDGKSISKKFKVQGSVDAQAATQGARPTLSNGTITLTPL